MLGDSIICLKQVPLALICMYINEGFPFMTILISSNPLPQRQQFLFKLMADNILRCFLLYTRSYCAWRDRLRSHRAQWSLDPWIEPSSRLSVCRRALRLSRRWSSASLEWKWGLCCRLPAADTALAQGSVFYYMLTPTEPWPLVRPPVGGGRPFCGGSLSSSPGGNERDSWRLNLGWTRPRQSAWRARTHTGPGSLAREPWPDVSRDHSAQQSEGWQARGKQTTSTCKCVRGKTLQLTVSALVMTVKASGNQSVEKSLREWLSLIPQLLLSQ